jgi:phenylalanyl-tRNA synthetase beta chain
VERILKALGLQSVQSPVPGTLQFIAPGWRRDLTREIDLIEEAARIHGYEQIPEDVPVPLEVSHTTPSDRLIARLADVLTAAGFYEAVTLSFVSESDVPLFRPWTDATPLRVEHSSRQRENILRQSLVPSLLHCRRQNERHGTFDAQLFEIARAYLAPEPGQPGAQPRLLSFISGRSFAEMKGIVEALLDSTNHRAKLSARPAALESCLPGRACELLVDDKRLGWLGEISDDVRKQLDLQNPVTAAEIDLSVLEAIAEFSPAYAPLPLFQGMQPDLNFLLDDAVTWQELEEVVRASGGPLLQGVAFESQYRGQQIPADKKSYVVRLNYRANDRTLTGEEVDVAKQKVIEACRDKLGATLR